MKSEIHSKDKIIMRVNNWKLKEIISSQMNRSVGKCISKCSRRSIIFVITELVTDAIYYFSINKVSKRSISLRCQKRKCCNAKLNIEMNGIATEELGKSMFALAKSTTKEIMMGISNGVRFITVIQ